MDLQLKGRVALVGGASQDRTGDRRAARPGRRSGRDGGAQGRAARARGGGDRGGGRQETFAIAADIRKAADCERITREALQRFGRIDVLVNNDGAPPLGDIESFDDTAWGRAVEQNLMSVVRLCRGALPSMRQNGWGRIVNITALSALQPIPRFGLSVATWAGVLGYAKTLSLELAATGITVHTICPGRIETPRLNTVFGTGTAGSLAADEMARMRASIPMGRLGTPEEIAGLVPSLLRPGPPT